MSTAIDLFLQDFVTTHKIQNEHYSWTEFVSRRFAEGGHGRKVFRFKSGGADCYAVGTVMALPDGDVFRIELFSAAATSSAGSTETPRLECLRMMSADTHTVITTDTATNDPGTLIIKLLTRNRGLMNVAFVIRSNPAAAIVDPLLC